MIHFLVSAHPLDTGQPDDLFADQHRVLTERGFSVSILPESVLGQGRRLRGVPMGADVVYRGWMLKLHEYAGLAAAIVEAGARPFTTPQEYAAAHHLPNWYARIADLTPETRVYDADAAMPRELAALGWPAFFVKDYVKSLKTSMGSIVHNPSNVVAVIDALKLYRDEIEGGICIRRVEEFLPETEVRYFAIRGRAFGPVLDVQVPEIVSVCAARIPVPFLSIDIVRRRDGQWRVVEVGDGQVSDLVGWDAETFAEIWARSTA